MNKQQKDELKKIIVEELENYYYKVNINSEEFANIVISKIPDTIITEDSIVEVLNRTVATLKYRSLSIEESVKRGAFISARYTNEEIAQEILQGEGWEVIDRMKIYEGNKAFIEFDYRKYVGHEIEIAIRIKH